MGMIVFITLMVAYAFLEAWHDHIAIYHNTSIDHKEGFGRRCVVATTVAVIVTVAVSGGIMGFASKLIVAYGAFTPVFRYKLNELRGKDWWYISRSNKYDSFFMDIDPDDLKKTATIAYTVELSALAIGLTINYLLA